MRDSTVSPCRGGSLLVFLVFCCAGQTEGEGEEDHGGGFCSSSGQEAARAYPGTCLLPSFFSSTAYVTTIITWPLDSQVVTVPTESSVRPALGLCPGAGLPETSAVPSMWGVFLPLSG